jgi:hypothetical protein
VQAHRRVCPQYNMRQRRQPLAFAGESAEPAGLPTRHRRLYGNGGASLQPAPQGSRAHRRMRDPVAPRRLPRLCVYLSGYLFGTTVGVAGAAAREHDQLPRDDPAYAPRVLDAGPTAARAPRRHLHSTRPHPPLGHVRPHVADSRRRMCLRFGAAPSRARAHSRFPCHVPCPHTPWPLRGHDRQSDFRFGDLGAVGRRGQAQAQAQVLMRMPSRRQLEWPAGTSRLWSSTATTFRRGGSKGLPTHPIYPRRRRRHRRIFPRCAAPPPGPLFHACARTSKPCWLWSSGRPRPTRSGGSHSYDIISGTKTSPSMSRSDCCFKRRRTTPRSS